MNDEPLTYESLRAIMESLNTWKVVRSRFIERGTLLLMDVDDHGTPSNFRDWTTTEQLEYARKTGMRVVCNDQDYREAIERLENEGGSVN